MQRSCGGLAPKANLLSLFTSCVCRLIPPSPRRAVPILGATASIIFSRRCNELYLLTPDGGCDEADAGLVDFTHDLGRFTPPLLNFPSRVVCYIEIKERILSAVPLFCLHISSLLGNIYILFSCLAVCLVPSGRSGSICYPTNVFPLRR